MPQQPERPLEISVETRLRIMTPRDQVSIPITLSEWESLRNRVSACKVNLQPWSIAYSMAFAIGVTAGLSILPIAFSDLPQWVLTIYIVFCALGFVVGGVLVFSERALAERQKSKVEEITGEMERTQGLFIQQSGES